MDARHCSTTAPLRRLSLALLIGVGLTALISAALVSAHPPEVWDDASEITPALTGLTDTLLDDEASEFIHKVQWTEAGCPTPTLTTTLDALQWLSNTITFADDLTNYGVADAWANPEQTLISGTGDYEDQAFLLASLLKWHTGDVITAEGDLIFVNLGFVPFPTGTLQAWVTWYDASDSAFLRFDPVAGEEISPALSSPLGTLWLSDERILGFLPGYYPGPLPPVGGYDEDDFWRIAQGGYGDPMNNYPWSMAAFDDDLYVGTGRNIPWRVINALVPGFPGLGLMTRPTGTLGSPEWAEDMRGEIWRYGSWEKVYTSPVVSHTGFFPREPGFRQMVTFSDTLYAANGGGYSPTVESLLLESSDGENWITVTTPVSMGTDSRAMLVHDGKLYVGLGTAPQVWAYDGVSWTLEGDFAARAPLTNTAVVALETFTGTLYAGTQNIASGFQVFKNDPLLGWTQVVSNGAGDRLNYWAGSMEVFKGGLYVGSMSLPVVLNPPGVEIVRPKGCELIRIAADDSWELIVGDYRPRLTPEGGLTFRVPASGWPGGFGNFFNSYCWSLQEVDGILYLGTFDLSSFLSFLPVEELVQLEELQDFVLYVEDNRDEIVAGLEHVIAQLEAFEVDEDYVRPYRQLLKAFAAQPDIDWEGAWRALTGWFAGGDLWKSDDGMRWRPLTLNGFDDPSNYGVRNMVHVNPFFVGMANPFDGLEILRTHSELELYYKFDDETTRATDASGNDNHGILSGDPYTSAVGICNDAFYFDGVDDYVSSSYATRPLTWTISAWVKADAEPGGQGPSYIVNRDGNLALGWDHDTPGLRGTAHFYHTGEGRIVSATFDIDSEDVNQWVHLAATWDGNDLRAYKDCSLTDLYTPTVSGYPSRTLGMVRIGTGDRASDRFFTGTIDEVRIWGMALDENEIAGLCKAQVAVLKYEDLDLDGSYDEGVERGLDGWELVLYDQDDEVDRMQTGAAGYVRFLGLAAGELYTVCEELPEHWVNSSPGGGVEGPREVCTTTGILPPVDACGEKLIRFGNYPKAQVQIVKFYDWNKNGQVDWGQPPEPDYLNGWVTWLLAPDGTEIISQTTRNSGRIDAVWVEPGLAYTMCEYLPEGWVSSWPGGGLKGPAEVCTTTGVLEPGEDFKGRFLNYAVGDITIIKQTRPPASDQNVDFDATDPLGSFALNAAGADRIVFNDIMSGTYTFTETVPAGWDLTGLAAEVEGDGGFVLEPDVNRATLSVGPAGRLTCTFTNTKLVTVTVRKYEDLNANGTWNVGEPWLQGWDMELSDSVGFIDMQRTDANGTVVWDGLAADKTYTVCETLKLDWLNSEPGGGFLCQSVSLTPGHEEALTFGNYQQGKITIKKDTLPAGEDDDFFFSGDLGDFTLNDASGDNAPFPDLDPGTYDVVEAPAFGWDLTDIVCLDASGGTTIDVPNGTASIDLASTDDILCTFKNEPLDSDGDGAFDYLECPGGQLPCDRDQDGIPNHLDYDPTGYIYELYSGRIITGGLVAVTGPHAGAVNLIHDGSDGFYQFTTDGSPGTYVISLTVPAGYVIPHFCPAQPLPLDPTGRPAPVVLGAGEVGDSGVLASGECYDNTYHWAFELEPGDPVVFNNNFPLYAIVGGETRPGDSLALLAPVLSLIALTGVVLTGALVWRRRAESF